MQSSFWRVHSVLLFVCFLVVGCQTPPGAKDVDLSVDREVVEGTAVPSQPQAETSAEEPRPGFEQESPKAQEP